MVTEQTTSISQRTPLLAMKAMTVTTDFQMMLTLAMPIPRTTEVFQENSTLTMMTRTLIMPKENLVSIM
jgi:hypothetical protein